MKEVSVALTTYNGEKFLKKQIDSILRQTQLPDEVVICDDISSDATISIIKEFKKIAPFEVILHQNKENIGSIKNFEKAISLCTGKIIFLSDQDDIWRNDRIKHTLTAFGKNFDAGFFFSNAGFINEMDEALDGNLWDGIGFSSIRQINFSKIENQALELRNLDVVTGATMAFKSELRKFFIPIPSELKKIRKHHDGWIAARLSLLGFYAIHSQEKLIDYRLHSKQQVGVKKDKKINETIRRAMHPSEGLKHELSIINLLINRNNYSFDINEKILNLKKHLESRIYILNLPKYKRITPLLKKIFSNDYRYNKYPLLSAAKDLIY